MENQPMRDRAYLAEETTSALPASAGKKHLSTRTKGFVALGLGAALLTGGATTLAYWSEQSTLAGAAISTGDLDLVPGIATWTLNSVDVTSTIASVKLVPGDVLRLSQPVGVKLEGNNIEAVLKTNVGTASTLPAGVTAQYQYGGSQLQTAGVTFTGATDTTSAPQAFVAEFTFEPSTANRDSTNSAINLQDIAVVLEQVAP